MLLTIFKSTRSNDTITSNSEKKNLDAKYLCRDYALKHIGITVMYTRPFVHRLEINASITVTKLRRKMFWVFVGGGVGGWGLRIKVSGVGTLYYLQNDWNRMMTHIC